MSLKQVATLTGHEGAVWGASFSPNGHLLATCGADHTIRVWAQDSKGVWVTRQVLDGEHSRTVRRVAWSPNGKYLAAASFDTTCSIWEELPDEEGQAEFHCIAQLDGHENEVKSIAWDASSSLLSTCSRDKSVWVWEMEADKEFACVSVGTSHSQDVKTVRWHPTRELIVSASYDDTLKVWMADDDDWYVTETLDAHDSTVWDVDFAPTGNEMASCSADKSIIVWKYEAPTTGKEGDIGVKCWNKSQTITDAHSRPIYSLSWSPKDVIATAAGDNSIAIYSRTSESEPFTRTHQQTQAHQTEVNCVSFDSSGRYLVSGGDDRTVCVWEVLPAPAPSTDSSTVATTTATDADTATATTTDTAAAT